MCFSPKITRTSVCVCFSSLSFISGTDKTAFSRILSFLVEDGRYPLSYKYFYISLIYYFGYCEFTKSCNQMFPLYKTCIIAK